MSARVVSDGPVLRRILVAVANLIAFGALAAVVSYWGWRWFGPAPAHIPPAARDDPVAALAVSPPFGTGTIVVSPDTGPERDLLAGEARLLGVLAETDGKGRALFRLPDGSARLLSTGETLTANVTLVAVRPDGVTVRDAGGERAIGLRTQAPASAGTSRRPGAARSVACAIPAGFKGAVVRLNAELVQGLISQPQALRTVADQKDGALEIRDDSGFAAMIGMKKGDRVAQANGIALRVPEDVIVAVLRPLAASQPVRLVGSRGGEPREVMVLNAGVCPG